MGGKLKIEGLDTNFIQVHCEEFVTWNSEGEKYNVCECAFSKHGTF